MQSMYGCKYWLCFSWLWSFMYMCTMWKKIIRMSIMSILHNTCRTCFQKLKFCLIMYFIDLKENMENFFLINTYVFQEVKQIIKIFIADSFSFKYMSLMIEKINYININISVWLLVRKSRETIELVERVNIEINFL